MNTVAGLIIVLWCLSGGVLAQDPKPTTGPLPPGGVPSVRPGAPAGSKEIIDTSLVPEIPRQEMVVAIDCLKMLITFIQTHPRPAWMSEKEQKELLEEIKRRCGTFKPGNHYFGTFVAEEYAPKPPPLAQTEHETSDGADTAEPNNNVIWNRSEFTGTGGAFQPMTAPNTKTTDDTAKKWMLAFNMFVELGRVIAVAPGMTAGPPPAPTSPNPGPPGGGGPETSIWTHQTNTVRIRYQTAQLSRYVYENRAALGMPNAGSELAATSGDYTETTTLAWVDLNQTKKKTPACQGFATNPVGGW